MDIIDFIGKVMGDILYGGWETFPEIRYEQECHEEGGEKIMETESLVSYLYQVEGYLKSGEQTLQTEPIREIIQALRRNGKYRGYKRHAEMWHELRSIVKSGKVYTLLPEGLSDKGVHISLIVKAFEKIEERHSEKPKREITKLIKELDKNVRELLREDE